MRVLISICSVIIMGLLFQVASVSAEQAFESLPQTFPGSGGFPDTVEPSGLPPAYPEWPDRAMRRDIMPLPPGGPYMSSALSEVDAFPADTGGLRNEFHEPNMNSPFFESDMPWPEIPERGRPRAWMPEAGGYNFVPEDVVRQLDFPERGSRPQFPAYPGYPGFRPVPPGWQQPNYGYR